MCIIVDANQASAFFADPFVGDYAPVVMWIQDRGGRLVFGGKLRDELYRVESARRLIRVWSSAGRAREINDVLVEAEVRAISALGLCRSDDHHVIALARCSGARILCSQDHNLIADFRNRSLIASPRGSIYRHPAHQHLLRHTGCGVHSPPVKKRRQ